MNFSRSFPFVRLLSFQLFGIAVANFLPGLERWFFMLFPMLLIWLAFLIQRKSYPFDQVHSVTLIVLVVLISFLNVHDRHDDQLSASPGLHDFEARVLTRPVEKKNSFQTVVILRQTDAPDLKGRKLLVYFEKDEKAGHVRPGDLIIAQSAVNEIRNSGNPFEFDYKRYMARRQIRHSSYVPTARYSVIPEDNPPLQVAVTRLQGKLASELKKRLPSDAAFQVVSALALGYRDELSQETRSYFISTGAMHVLAVSGLHVGMIFVFLKTILFFLRRTAAGKVMNLVIVASCLWGYALLTGLSPSVQRAAVMFSFILIGNSMNRQASIYNSLAASAFFLLFFNPDLIFDAGFQLSYLAVLGIVFFYPKLVSWIPARNPVLNFGWKLTCVSMAAQLSTFPLSVFYFHQFPVYFWLSNLLVVPVSSVILALTGLFFITLPITTISSFFAQILSITTDFTLSLLKRIGEFPFAVIDIQWISVSQFFCLLLALSGAMAFIVHRKHIFLFMTLSFLLLFQLAELTHKISLFDQRKLIVYQTGPGEQLIHLIGGRTNYLIMGTGDPPNPYLYQNVLRNLRLDQPVFITPQAEKDLNDVLVHDRVIQFADKSLVLERDHEILQEKLFRFSRGLLDLNRTGDSLICIEPGMTGKSAVAPATKEQSKSHVK